MRHLSPEDLLDIADGTRPESSAVHLGACDACRGQVVLLRRMLVVAAAVEVPDPSPLFWDHLSARVRDAVAAEQSPAPGWRLGWVSWRLTALVSAAAVVLAVGLVLRIGQGAMPRTGSLDVESHEVEISLGDPVVSMEDDPSLRFLADLAGGLDWDGAAEAGIAIRFGAADRAFTELTGGERVEVRRLLHEEVAGSGA